MSLFGHVQRPTPEFVAANLSSVCGKDIQIDGRLIWIARIDAEKFVNKPAIFRSGEELSRG